MDITHFPNASKREAATACAYLRTHRFYTHRQRRYINREGPSLFPQKAAILSVGEGRVPGHIPNLVKRHPTPPMYDGAIYEEGNIDDAVSISNECTDAAMELMIGIEVKRRGPLPHIIDESRLVETWSTTQSPGSEEFAGLLVKIEGVNISLYSSVRFLHIPNIDVPPNTAGPPISPHLYKNVSKHSEIVDMRATHQYLVMRDKSELTRAGRQRVAKFDCYFQPTSHQLISGIARFLSRGRWRPCPHNERLYGALYTNGSYRFAQNTLKLVTYVFFANDLPTSGDNPSCLYDAKRGRGCEN